MADKKRETSLELLRKQFEQITDREQQVQVIKKLVIESSLPEIKHYLLNQDEASLKQLKVTASAFEDNQKKILGHFEGLAPWLITLIDKKIADNAEHVRINTEKMQHKAGLQRPERLAIASTQIPASKEEITQFSTLGGEQQYNFVTNHLLQDMGCIQMQKYLAAQTADSLGALKTCVVTVMSFAGSNNNGLVAAATWLKPNIEQAISVQLKMAALNAKMANIPAPAAMSTSNILSASSPIAPPKPTPTPSSTSESAATAASMVKKT